MKRWPPDHPRLTYDESGAGAPIVLLHAFPQDRRQFDGPRAALSEWYRVVAVDLPGFGGSPARPWTVESFAAELADFIGEVLREPAVVGGVSMGGYVALTLATLVSPGLVRGLILADTRAEADTPEALASRARSIALVEADGVTALVDSMLPRLVTAATRRDRPEVVDAIRSRGVAQSPQAVLHALAALRDRPDVTSGLSGFESPALVIVGAGDELTPPAAARAMADALPDATLVTIPGAGHLADLEQPAVFVDAVRAFLDRV